MNIRKLKTQDDFNSVVALCEKNNLQVPKIEYCLIAETDGGEIIGFTNIASVPTIDCFVADSPMVARRLYDNACGVVLGSGKESLQVFTKRKDVIELYKHLDFTILGEDYTIARKDF